MNEYAKRNKIIHATEKAYNLIYKDKGYKPFIEKAIEEKEKAIEEKYLEQVIEEDPE